MAPVPGSFVGHRGLTLEAPPVLTLPPVAYAPPVGETPPVGGLISVDVTPPVGAAPPVVLVPPVCATPPVDNAPPTGGRPPVLGVPPLGAAPPVCAVPPVDNAPPVDGWPPLLVVPPVVAVPPKAVDPLVPARPPVATSLLGSEGSNVEPPQPKVASADKNQKAEMGFMGRQERKNHSLGLRGKNARKSSVSRLQGRRASVPLGTVSGDGVRVHRVPRMWCRERRLIATECSLLAIQSRIWQAQSRAHADTKQSCQCKRSGSGQFAPASLWHLPGGSAPIRTRVAGTCGLPERP